MTEPEVPAAATPGAVDAAGEATGDDPPAEPAVDAGAGARGVANEVPAQAMQRVDAYDDLGQPVPARAFDPAVAAEIGEYGVQRPPRVVCMWCNAELASADLATCPHCGAALKPVSDDIDIPGVTVAPVDLKKAREAAAEAVARTLARPSDAIAAPGMRPDLEPPNDAVRRAMEELAAAERQAEDVSEAAPATSSAGSPARSSAEGLPPDVELGSASEPDRAHPPEAVEPSA